MLVGAMNNPARPLEDELRRIAASGFAAADVTLEPPGAWPVDGGALRALLSELGLVGIGHTAYYLPIASPFPKLRAAAHASMHEAFDVFALAEIDRVNVHPDRLNSLFSPADAQARNAEALAELTDAAAERGLLLMLENLGPPFASAAELAPLFDAAPELRFHLDVGHANLRGPNRTAELLDAFGNRLAHVHVSDNRGVDDLHLPLGTGSIDWPGVVEELRAVGWDGAVTLEIFTATPVHLESSRQLWLEWWSSPSG